MRLWRMTRDDGGQAMVLIAIMFMTLLFFVGLAVDAGQLYVAKRTEQEAADAAAFAAAIVIYQSGERPPSAVTITNAISAAVTQATRNGYTNGVSDTVVTVVSPPATGVYAGNVYHVEVSITRQVRTTLVPAESILNPVRARGVAGAEPMNSGYAIIALDRGNTPSAFYADNNADINIAGGGILVNSSSATAVVNNQTSCSKFIMTGGTVDIDGHTSSSFPSGCTPSFPAVNQAVPQKPDPFALFPKPSTTGMTDYTALPGGNPIVMNPGVYDSTASLNTNNVIYQLNSGIYILRGSSIDISGSHNSSINSQPGGVFIFLTHTNYPNAFRPGTDTCGYVNLQGNSTTNLIAMTTGTYANFLYYQDPNCTTEMKTGGNGTFNGTGTIYVPNAAFVFAGNNATLSGSQLVAKTVNVQSGNLTIDWSAGETSQPILPRLAE
jgi:hypothetical protein